MRASFKYPYKYRSAKIRILWERAISCQVSPSTSLRTSRSAFARATTSYMVAVPTPMSLARILARSTIRLIANGMDMKNIVIGLAFTFFLFISAGSAEAKTVSVKGYYKPSTGSYVMPSYRTSPNKTKLDNYSTKGNYNPYSGKTGTRVYSY